MEESSGFKGKHIQLNGSLATLIRCLLDLLMRNQLNMRMVFLPPVGCYHHRILSHILFRTLCPREANIRFSFLLATNQQVIQKITAIIISQLPLPTKPPGGRKVTMDLSLSIPRRSSLFR